MNRLLLTLGILMLLWVALLGFNIVSEPTLREDTAGWLALGLAFCFASSHPRANP